MSAIAVLCIEDGATGYADVAKHKCWFRLDMTTLSGPDRQVRGLNSVLPPMLLAWVAAS